MSQSLLEYLYPVHSSSRRAMCLAALRWLRDEHSRDEFTATEIKNALVAARVPRAKTFNVADVLGKAGHYVTTAGKN